MYNTNRATVEAVDKLIGEEVKILDHGYIKLVDYLGDDSAIAQAARTSYQKGTKSASEDAGLLKYLLEHKHTTPFEMCEIKFEIKLPIFVARQWIRHRTANVNEMSARYSILEKEFYIPEPENCLPQSQTNKQGRGGELADADREAARIQLTEVSEACYEAYEFLLAETAEGEGVENGIGLARELSRMIVPPNFYTRWFWKIDLHNLLHFLRLRMDSHAQYEIRVYADAIYEIVKQWVPQTCAAFENAVLNAVTFTGEEVNIIRSMLNKTPNTIILRPTNWSDRKWADFLVKAFGE